MPSPDTAPPQFSPDECRRLLDIARDAVQRGVDGGWSPLSLDALPPSLCIAAATFVTLRGDDEELLGCIGTLEPIRAVAADVDHNAASAAFADPRLPPISRDDLDRLRVKISVLGSITALDVRDFSTLRDVLRPGVDGLLVTDGRRRGTFLPSVWEQVPDPDHFVELLWQKAGIEPGTWPAGVRVGRYETVEFGD